MKMSCKECCVRFVRCTSWVNRRSWSPFGRGVGREDLPGDSFPRRNVRTLTDPTGKGKERGVSFELD